jgi:hypothetical protein
MFDVLLTSFLMLLVAGQALATGNQAQQATNLSATPPLRPLAINLPRPAWHEEFHRHQRGAADTAVLPRRSGELMGHGWAKNY